MDNTLPALAACLAVLAVLVILAVVAAQRRAGAPKGPQRDGFYTEHGREEPTRSHVPYTGTIPYGHWGNVPWAEMVPRGNFPRRHPRHCANHSSYG